MLLAGSTLLCSGAALSFCTCAQRAPGSGCGCLCSTPVQSQKHFTTRQLKASFHAQKGGVCCKPATFPSSHSPLSRSIVCLKSSPLSRDCWRVVFPSSFPSISSPCLYYLWSGRFFLEHCSCCSLEAGRKAAAFLCQQGADEALEM